MHQQHPELEFHPSPIDYVIEHKYTPDFYFENHGVHYYLEVKGYFQDAHEIQKYVWIKDELDRMTVGGRTSLLVFVFENPHKPIHFKAKKKDGTKMTHAQWATKNGFQWIDANDQVELEELING